MAEYTKTLSGGSASSQYRIRMVVTESDVNINNNTSKVNVTAYIDKLSGSGYFSNDGKPWNIKIDGSTVASGNKTYDFRNYTTLTLGSGSKTITHNSDGSKSVAISAYFNSILEECQKPYNMRNVPPVEKIHKCVVEKFRELEKEIK